jgi:hypothetical protein
LRKILENKKERAVCLEINIREDRKIVELWLTRAEGENTELRQRLQPLYRVCRAKKYLVAVFVSGGQDLSDAAGGLLCYNCGQSARLEAEREKQASQAALPSLPKESSRQASQVFPVALPERV